MGKHWVGKGKVGGNNDVSSCRGHGAIVGTCDASREREASKELTNLLTQAIEEFYPASPSVATNGEGSGSIRDMLQQELELIRAQKHDQTQAVLSINTGVKGIVLVKIMRTDVDPVNLLRHIFLKIKKDGEACCRHLVRLIPLQSVFYPNEEELRTNLKDLLSSTAHFPSEITSINTSSENSTESTSSSLLPVSKKARVEDAMEESSTIASLKQGTVPAKLFMYGMSFKARNSSSLSKSVVQSILFDLIPPTLGRLVSKNYKGSFVVEALKNICGLSYVEESDDFEGFNVRKYAARCSSNSKCNQEDVQTVDEATVVPPSDDSHAEEECPPVTPGNDK